MVLPDTVPVNRRPVGSMTVVPDSRGSSGSSNTMTTAPGATPSRAPGAGVEETGTACAEAVAGRISSSAADARMRPPSRADQPPPDRAIRWKIIGSLSALTPGRQCSTRARTPSATSVSRTARKTVA